MNITIEQHEEIISLSTPGCHALGYHSKSIGEAFYAIGNDIIEADEH